MPAYIRFILKRRFIVLAVIGVVTAGAGYIVSQGRLATSLGEMFLGESPGYHRYKERIADFGSDNLIIYGFHDPDLLTPKGLQRLQQAVEGIQEVPQVARVDSILSVNKMERSGDRLELKRYTDEITAHPGRTEELAAALVADPLAAGLLISEDGEHGAVVIELTFDESATTEEGPALMATLTDKFLAAGYATDQLHRAGLMTVIYEVMAQTMFSINRVMPVVLIILVLIVWLMFRQFWPVIINGIVSIIAATWTMALAVLWDKDISILMAMVPSVIMTIAFCDVIHLCSSYLIELSNGLKKRDAIIASGAEVGKACVWTSVTTFIGFVSMALIPTPVFRQMGVVLGFGVSVALLLAVTLAPILFSLLKEPKAWESGSASVVQGWLDSLLGLIQRLATARPWVVVGVFAVILAVSVGGIYGINVDVDFTRRLDEDNQIRKDELYFEEHFASPATLEIFVETPQAEGLLDPVLFAEIARYQEQVELIEGTDQAYSLVDVVREVHRVMRPPEDTSELPATRAAMAQYMLLLEMSGDSLGLERFVDFNRQKMRLMVRLPGQGVRECERLGAESQRLAKAVARSGTGVEPTGTFFLTGEWLTKVVDSQEKGLLLAIFTIAVMMILGLRTFGAGLLSMIPNLLPLLVLGGYVGYMWDIVDSDTMGVAMMAIGIGVDDTIHFLMRYKTELKRSAGVGEAITRTLRYAGRGIVITSTVLIAGFAPFAMSDYMPVHTMGTMLPLTLFVALIADLFLVPAMARLGWFKFPTKTGDYVPLTPLTGNAVSTKPALKILLVNPHDATYKHGDSAFKKTVTYYALTMPTLASLVPPELNASVRVVDEGIQGLAGLEEADLVGITAITPSAPRAYEIAGLARELGKTVVLGGPHPTLMPDEAALHADAVVVGFAEDTWPELLRDHAAGKLKKMYRQAPKVDLGGRPIAKRNLLDLNRYLGIPVLQAARGCPNTCKFCSIPAMWGKEFYKRPVADVVKEIEALGSSKLLFLDPSMAESRAYGIELFKALAPLHVKWGGLSTVKMAFDDELLKLAQKSGCKGILVGFESIVQDSLAGINKRFNEAANYKEAVQRFHDHGIAVLGTFVFGLDHEDKDVFKRTAEFIDDARIDLVRFSVYTPFPGTPAFEELDQQGRIITRDWTLYNTENVVYRPLHMTVEELQEGLATAWRHTYSMSSIFHRVRWFSSMGPFSFAANMGFRFYAKRAVRGLTK